MGLQYKEHRHNWPPLSPPAGLFPLPLPPFRDTAALVHPIPSAERATASSTGSRPCVSVVLRNMYSASAEGPLSPRIVQSRDAIWHGALVSFSSIPCDAIMCVVHRLPVLRIGTSLVLA